MKKNFIYALLGAIVLTGAIGLTGCADKIEEVEENPNFNPETGEVPVNLVFNVSTSNTPATRMTSANTQASTTENFRGINNAQLLSFKLTKTTGTGDEATTSPDDGKIVSSALTADKVYNFGTILAAGKIDPNTSATDGSVTKSRRVVELSLPTETNTLMCWGKAIKTSSNHEQGKVTFNVNKNLSETSISLCKIIPATAETDAPLNYEAAFLQYEKLIAGVLTEIVQSKVLSGTTVTYGDESRTLENGLAWSDFVAVTSSGASRTLAKKSTAPFSTTEPMCALGEILGNAFFTMNTIYANELRSGSGVSISHMIKDLMVLINSVCDASPVSLEEVASQEVAKVIKTNVEKYFDSTNEYSWRSMGPEGTAGQDGYYAGIKATLVSVLDTDKDKIDEGRDLNNFPADFNLPLGSVILQFLITDITNDQDEVTGYNFAYAYKGAVETYAMGGSTTTDDSFNPLNYTYPAELCYFGNSPIRVTNETKVANDFPDGVAEWDNEGTGSLWAGWTKNGHVLSSTRSVAMQYNINYGTALLKTTVRYGAQTLYDNNAAIQRRNTGATESNNSISVTTNDDHFVLTGVLVGGQEAEVGWNYLAKSSSPGFGMMVYDKVESTVNNKKVDYIQIPKATASEGGNQSAANYTLLWDNWQQSLLDQKQRDVYVALEFRNNSKDFWGENNLIRNGGTFYIVGKLDPDNGQTAQNAEVLYTADDAEVIAGTKQVGDVKTPAVWDYSAGITWPEKQALPPYDSEGNTIKQRRVFIQDFMTTANFVIGPNSLQHALVAVPDLRSGQISLGLSVDLVWQTGLTFNDIILGDR